MARRRSRRRGNMRAALNSSSGRFAIPQYEAEPFLTKTFRFEGTVAPGSPVNITAETILSACGVVGSVTNLDVAQLWASFKIKRLRIWSAPASVSANANTITVVWAGAGTVSNTIKIESDTSISTAVPLYLDLVPPPESAAAFWNIESSGALFQIEQLGTSSPLIVDLTLDLKMNSGGFASHQVGVSTAVVGELYFLALDGPSTNLLVPVALGTTH